MAYIIRKTDGTTLGTILDGTVDNSKTSLTLIGRNYSNYGQFMADNLVSLLENFAYSIAPSNPLAGQLWWNTSDQRLRVYTGSTFKIVSSCTSQSTAPVSTVAGDLWWDSTEEQLYVYNGLTPYSLSGWILVGPPYKKTKGRSGAIWEQITDTTSSVHDVVSLYLNGVRTSIISTDSEFTPLNAITGFATIKQGLTGNTSVNSAQFFVTANNANYLGGTPASSFLRADSDDSTVGSLSIGGNVSIGTNNNFLLATTNSNGVAYITNNRNNSNIIVSANVGGTITTALTVDGSTGTVSVSRLNITNSTASTSSSTGAFVVTGGVGIGGALNVGAAANFAGVATAVTAPALTANTMIATTEFVINNSGFLKNKIYDSNNTYIEVNDSGVGNARVVIDGTTVATATNSGFNLSNGAVAVTQPQTYNESGNARVATTQFVKTATTWWGGSAKFVSTSAPNEALGNNGDFWFQRSA